jgi:small subunit ribosomal protein S6
MGLNEDVLRFLNIRVEEVEDSPSIMMQAKTDRPQRSGRDDVASGEQSSNSEFNSNTSTNLKSED